MQHSSLHSLNLSRRLTLPQSLTLKPCLHSFSRVSSATVHACVGDDADVPSSLRSSSLSGARQRTSLRLLSRRIDEGRRLLFSGEATNRQLVSETVTTLICSALSACDRLTATTVSPLCSSSGDNLTAQKQRRRLEESVITQA
ncbi:hypothetical protein PIB30_078112 [Stylosanthes scabra]|uniref:Uncharacterized protein n=1 Tax=Stylosanthes scabra TaxID=79078 RepID=A0ABU6YQ76_9FABA|nr:hypothetical protein [Stylosanthes scabra]